MNLDAASSVHTAEVEAVVNTIQASGTPAQPAGAGAGQAPARAQDLAPLHSLCTPYLQIYACPLLTGSVRIMPGNDGGSL